MECVVAWPACQQAGGRAGQAGQGQQALKPFPHVTACCACCACCACREALLGTDAGVIYELSVDEGKKERLQQLHELQGPAGPIAGLAQVRSASHPAILPASRPACQRFALQKGQLFKKRTARASLPSSADATANCCCPLVKLPPFCRGCPVPSACLSRRLHCPLSGAWCWRCAGLACTPLRGGPPWRLCLLPTQLTA